VALVSRAGEGTGETDPDDLLEVEDAHLALVEAGALPFFVHVGEAVRAEQSREAGSRSRRGGETVAREEKAKRGKRGDCGALKRRGGGVGMLHQLLRGAPRERRNGSGPEGGEGDGSLLSSLDGTRLAGCARQGRSDCGAGPRRLFPDATAPPFATARPNRLAPRADARTSPRIRDILLLLELLNPCRRVGGWPADTRRFPAGQSS
jgi:hypothetical protein